MYKSDLFASSVDVSVLCRRLVCWTPLSTSADSLEHVCLQVMSKRFDEVTQLLGKPEEVEVASDPELGPLSEWKEVFKTCQVSWHFGQQAKPCAGCCSVLQLPCTPGLSHCCPCPTGPRCLESLGWLGD